MFHKKWVLIYETESDKLGKFSKLSPGRQCSPVVSIKIFKIFSPLYQIQCKSDFFQNLNFTYSHTIKRERNEQQHSKLCLIRRVCQLMKQKATNWASFPRCPLEDSVHQLLQWWIIRDSTCQTDDVLFVFIWSLCKWLDPR